MDRRNKNRRRVAAFTLLEVLLVLVILVVLAAMATRNVIGQQDKALRNAALSQVQLFARTVDQYRFDMKKFPESLEELVNKPSDAKLADRWAGPYLNKKSIPLDPWDQEYRYEAKEDSYRVWSVGPDGSDGSDDDIASDDEES